MYRESFKTSILHEQEQLDIQNAIKNLWIYGDLEKKIPTQIIDLLSSPIRDMNKWETDMLDSVSEEDKELVESYTEAIDFLYEMTEKGYASKEDIAFLGKKLYPKSEDNFYCDVLPEYLTITDKKHAVQVFADTLTACYHIYKINPTLGLMLANITLLQNGYVPIIINPLEKEEFEDKLIIHTIVFATENKKGSDYTRLLAFLEETYSSSIEVLENELRREKI